MGKLCWYYRIDRQSISTVESAVDMGKPPKCNCMCCPCGVHTVGFWGTYNQAEWQVDFPATWTKLTTRDSSNLSACNVLVIGRYSFSSPYSAQPTTGGEHSAVASWVTGGGVLFVLHEYYGSPSAIPSTPVTALNTSLAGIGTQARGVLTAGPAPNATDTPMSVTADVTVVDPVLKCVKKLTISAPGYMSLGTSTLLFQARKSTSTAYADILSIESFGAGFVVFCSDFSMVNNFDATSRASTGNKIAQFLCNLGEISTN